MRLKIFQMGHWKLLPRKPMIGLEYMRILIRLVLSCIIKHYNLNDLGNRGGYLYMEMIKGMYGLSQANIIENKLLAQCLSNHRY